ncbi:choice-of-anchor D domain-containing protein [Dactylosporangium vinaceum]|uniref:Choice-of-anchor D domain-containing protein n=1 Tax=Dactylosporangium vinaceum TaxID=53362 RepID=A0ABV5M853_9ACTN|nr:choice-of-anchor D domain-containing protein [Dactylosporangium vinaceum]UAB94309.1 choice-of-anchor D domain-containing protein [Dactylosporangium vinaceum]
MRIPRARTAALVAAATLAAAGVAVWVATPALAAATGGVGATLPYVQVQAENAATNGTVIGPSAAYNTLPAEASYRKAVTLQGQGKYVEFTTPVATNSLVFRYSIPDTASGSVYTAPISLYVNGTRSTNFTLTNAYSWYYGGYPFTNQPGSNAHHFYDEVNRLFPTTYPAGTKFKLQVDSDSTASSYTIDFADFENVGPALAQPSGSVSITSKGADPTGVQDSTSALNAAIAQAGSGGTVWIPEGTFKVLGHIAVNNITIKGAGMWRSRTTGDRIGFYGNYAPTPSTNVHLADFAIFGNVQERNDGDQVNGIGGALTDSTVDRVWIEHTKVGAWMDGPFTNLVMSGLRLRNFTADGVNFHNGVTNSKVTNSDVRNAGDDGLAMWAEQNPDANNSFDHNTVQYPILANGIAIYGGHDNFVTDNRVVDSGLTQGGGIHVAQRFASTTLGRTDVLRNTVIRSGSLDPNWQFGVGALWFDARDGGMTGLTNVDNILIQQSPFEAIQFVSGSNITNVKINNATIQNTGTWAVQEQVGGSATISNSTATGVQAPAAIYNCGVGFTLTDGGGNSGLSTTGCSNIQNPTFPPYLPDNGSNINISPSALGFGSVVTGSTSASQAVTVTNSGSASAPIGTIAVTGDFAQTTTCGSSLAAGASCTVSVTFKPTAAGSRTGALSITASGIANSVPLSGTGVAPGPIVNANPGSLTFGGTVVGTSAATQTVTLNNSGTTAATVSAIAASGDFSQTNTCGSSIAVGASCAVTVRFTPTASGSRTGTLTVTSSANNSPATVSLSGSGIGTDTNIALNRAATASSQVNGTQTPATVTDGNAATYWESANNAFPQWVQVDLGAATSIGKVTLKLPPDTAWATRTQTLSVTGSTDGTNFSTLSASAARTFNPASGNTVAITVPASSVRYVRVNVSANTGWPAAQLSELEVYPSGGGTPNAPVLSASPASLSYATQALNTTSAAQSVTITNTGTAAATVSGVSVSGDFAQTNNCGSIAVGASCSVSVTFRPTASGGRTGTLTVTSNANNSPTTVALSGTGAGSAPTDLAAGKATSESSHNDVYPSGNVVDNNQNTYWESTNNAFPQWVQVDLGSAQSASRVVLQLPAGWGARTQRIQVQGSTNGSSFTELKAATDYSFAPGSNNTVTITFTATTQRYFRLTFTSNTGWPAGQLSTFQVWSS